MLHLKNAICAALGIFLVCLQTPSFAESGKSKTLGVQLAQATQLAIAENRDDARDLLQKITREYPDSPEAYNNLAVLAAYSEDWKEAINLLKKAMATSTSLQTSYQNLNAIYRYQAALAYRAALPTEKSSTLPLPDLTMLTSPSTAQISPPSSASAPAVDIEIVDEKLAREQVQTALESWASAWSAQDVEGYLSSYSENYTPDAKMSHGDWRVIRRQRLLKPSFIEVSVQNTSIDVLSPKRALITFTQQYRSEAFSDSVKKLVVMQRVGDDWNISREHVVQ